MGFWWKRYQQGGWSGRKMCHGGRSFGAEGKLSAEQEKEVVQKLITDQIPDQLKMKFALWTREEGRYQLQEHTPS